MEKGITQKWFLTFFLQIRRRGAFRWFRCGTFSICRENNRNAEPAAAARKGGRAKNRPKTGEKGLKSEFSPFFCTFGVGVLCGGLGAALFPPIVQTIAKVSQQRRQKKEGGRKTGRKQVEKGFHKSQSCGTSGQNRQKTFGTKSLESSYRRSAQSSDEREGRP